MLYIVQAYLYLAPEEFIVNCGEKVCARLNVSKLLMIYLYASSTYLNPWVISRKGLMRTDQFIIRNIVSLYPTGPEFRFTR